MFRYSWTYRLLAGSWFLGWLVSAPAEVTTDINSGSVLAPAARRGSNDFLQWLYRFGTCLNQLFSGSRILSHGLGLLGIFILFYGLWRLAIGAGLRIPLVLILVGIALSALQFIPGASRGSWFLSLFRWWSRTD
jgi:hypothetical protein